MKCVWWDVKSMIWTYEHMRIVLVERYGDERMIMCLTVIQNRNGLLYVTD